MAAYPTFSTSDLADYTGKAESALPAYATESLVQARLLFRLATCLGDGAWPDDQDMSDLAWYAVMSAAEYLMLQQPYREIVAGPFMSENMGSYSYAKGRNFDTAKVKSAIQAGLPTGITWFDMAVDRLGQCETVARVEHGSIQLFEHDLPTETLPDGTTRIIGPEEENPVDLPFVYSRPVADYDPNSQMR